MDTRLQKIYEDMENNTLGIDDTFQFKCRTCGKCCKNRHDIILTTRDLHNIARSLGRSMQYIVEQYCHVYIGHSSRIPIVRLKPTGPEQTCPLLRNRRCIVHSAKPIVCALFPLGRAMNVEASKSCVELTEKIQPTYFLQPDTCGSKDQTHTVRSWLEEFGVPVQDEFYSLWTENFIYLSDAFRKFDELKIPDKQMQPLWDLTYSAAYVSYDTEKDLIPQFQESMVRLRGFFEKVMAVSEKHFGGMRNGTQT